METTAVQTEEVRTPEQPPARDVRAGGLDRADDRGVGHAMIGAAARPGVSLTPATVASLQRNLGNRRVAAVLAARQQVARQNQPKPGPMPTDETKTVRGLPGLPLSKELRDRFEKETHSRINQAFTAFTSAAKAHAEALKAEAKAEAEMVAATIDIFFGLAAPIFANWVMQGGGANTFLKRGADKVANALSTASATEAAKTVKLISETDFLKETFKGVGKIGTTAIKLNATALFGESEADVFARQLRDAMHVGVQAITDKIADLTDEQLIATWVTYDVEFTSESVYVETLKKTFANWKRLVATIGSGSTSSGYGGSGTDVKAVWMNAYGKRRLAVVSFAWVASAFYSDNYRLFYGWVPEELEQFVIAKSLRKFGAIEEIDPASIRGHVPDPVTGK